MWHQAGFLADALAVIKRHGYSVDLISTLESTVTVSLDPQVSAHFDEGRMSRFRKDLEKLCKVTLHSGCMSISPVRIGRIKALFQRIKVYLPTCFPSFSPNLSQNLAAVANCDQIMPQHPLHFSQIPVLSINDSLPPWLQLKFES